MSEERIPFIIMGDGAINLIIDSKTFTITRDHQNYEEIKGLLAEGTKEELLPLVSIEEDMKIFCRGKIEIREGIILYNEKEIHSTLTNRIVTLMQEGFPIGPMVKFLENLMENPSYRAINELYSFLEHKGLPITEDGTFLAYKAIRENFTDKRSGTFKNTPGSIIKMPRSEVDDNCNNHCSFGFHVGAIDYVRDFANQSDKIVLVKVNPKDCVSVPIDYDAQKIRVCEYEVMREIDKETILEQVVYREDGKEWVHEGDIEELDIEDLEWVSDDEWEQLEINWEEDPCLSCGENDCHDCSEI